MATLLVSHPDCLDHDTGPFHPESTERLRSLLHALEKDAFSTLQRCDAPCARVDQLARVHDAQHIQYILDHVPTHGHYSIDGDTVMSPMSGQAALRATGGVCHAVDMLMAEGVHNAFVAVRPPGHHAGRHTPCGFCLFNNIAVGAMHARDKHGLQRIGIIDWDVHHGNGTQDIFWNDPDVFYASTHQAPLYPGTGSPNETGAHGTIMNFPLAPGTQGTTVLNILNNDILPALRAFQPNLIMISAGFDAHENDPLADLNLTTDDYGTATQSILDVAEDVCAGRVISVLEGGYNLQAIASSASAHVLALMHHKK